MINPHFGGFRNVSLVVAGTCLGEGVKCARVICIEVFIELTQSIWAVEEPDHKLQDQAPHRPCVIESGSRCVGGSDSFRWLIADGACQGLCWLSSVPGSVPVMFGESQIT